MYINKIDDLIDKVIDDIFIDIVLENKAIHKILQEPNFVKYQKEINTIINEFMNTINLDEVRDLVKSSDAVNTIHETIKRYSAIYLFLTIGVHYTGKEDTFINNIVEFTKNQAEYGFKIDNFFNSESNALLIKYNKMIRNIIYLMETDQAKIETIKHKPEIREAIIFLNSINSEIRKGFKLDNVGNDKNTQTHNILKTIIVLLLYRTTEKKEFFRLLEMTENLEGEYMFIDIVVPKQKYIDFNSVERLVGTGSKIKHLSHYLWEFLTSYENALQQPPTSVEEKINMLIQSGIIYPICDDFLLYHKDSERYDKTIDPEKVKKKEDTKVRYIINKIEIVSEYYSEQVKRDPKIKDNIKKKFYVPLSHRKAITVNNNEDINIVNKFLNQGKISIENAEYFNDLIAYKAYPYVNFKEFETYGFSITVPKTINAVRYVSFNKSTEFRQNSKNYLQMRVCGKDSTINVVGFIIPSNLKSLECVRTKELIDLSILEKKNINGLDLTTKFLRDTNVGMSPHKSSVYWLFDMENDSTALENTTYEQGARHTTSDQIKQIVASLYDNMISEIYYLIVSKAEKIKDFNLQIAYNLLQYYEKNILNISNNSNIMAQLENKIFETIAKFEPSYDRNDDVINGIGEHYIDLPEYPKPNKKNVHFVKIDMTETEKILEIEEKESVEGICQHNVTWEQLSELKTDDPKTYTEQMYTFIQQYVIENVDQDFICKSCGHYLNIKKYIIDGVFDDDSQKFITYSMPMEVALEDIPEYEKYKITIRNMDKLIEKVASVSNIPHLTKTSSSVKARRKPIVKDGIDIIMLNNKRLKLIYEDRNKAASTKYNINRDLSDFFVFELDNSIFIFSSKDKDYRKPIKQNNILAYLVFLITLEINESHVGFLGDRKGLCNFQTFEKIFHQLFDGLKIITNAKGNLEPITKYKIFCYVIYIIGCSIVKYNMWYYDYPENEKRSKFVPIIQKIFVHTLIDLINSIMEGISGSDNYIYEMLSIKFFKKLTGMFSSEELYVKLQNEYKTSVIGEKKNFIVAQKKLLELSGKFIPMDFDVPYRFICRQPRFISAKRKENIIKYYEKNNITNCIDGQFHKWSPSSGKIICKICNVNLENLELDEKISSSIVDNFKFVRLRNLSTTFCLDDGLRHQFMPQNSKNICIKCNYTDDHEYSHTELLKLEKIIESTKEKLDNEMTATFNEIGNKISKEEEYINKIVEKTKKAYNNINKHTSFDFIDIFLEEVQQIIGTDHDLLNVSLKDNAYIITHDHLGYLLDKPVTITDNSKIIYKQNHPFFKTDVIYYTTFKNGKTEVFYDATTKILLGHKEESKNFVLNKTQEVRLIINYSILNKLKLLGFASQFIDISGKYDNLMEGKENIKSDSNIIISSILHDIVRDRVYSIKKAIYEFNKVITRIFNGYSEVVVEDESNYFSKNINGFVEKYKKKINSLLLTDQNDEHPVFKHWKAIMKGFTSIDTSEINYDHNITNVVNCENIYKVDSTGNYILFYLVEELQKLIAYNSQNEKINITILIIDFINTIFELFNTEKIVNNIEVKRFIYMLNSSTYIQEIIEKSGEKETEGIYNELQEEKQEINEEQKEEMEDIEEENDAIDMESEIQYEGEFDRGIDRAIHDYS